MNERKYYGLYCPQHGIWLKEDDKHILYYPDAVLTQAHLNQMQVEAEHFSAMRLHLWEVTQIGQEQRVKPEDLPPLSSVCTEPVNRFKDLGRCA